MFAASKGAPYPFNSVSSFIASATASLQPLGAYQASTSISNVTRALQTSDHGNSGYSGFKNIRDNVDVNVNYVNVREAYAAVERIWPQLLYVIKEV